MMNRIIAECLPGQTRLALLEDGQLAEYYVERPGREKTAGNIYKGRVENVLPGMEAAFVQMGLQKNGFLYAGDVALSTDEFDGSAMDRPPIRKLVSPGQEILVQVTKDAHGTKGARVTTHITLPSRSLVLMPTVDYVGVSRRIEDEEERTRLKNWAESVRDDGMGIILRTVASNAEPETLQQEYEELVALWRDILHTAQLRTAPACIYKDSDLLMRAVRDILNDSTSEFLIDNPESYERAHAFAQAICPEYADRIRLFDQGVDIFDYYSLEEKVDKSFQRRIWLKSGGNLIFDYTEALTVIDVNTSKFVGDRQLETTILKTNLEAVEEIAKQIRLRDIGGIILMDLIDMESPEHRNQVLSALREALAKDRTRTNVVGFTGLGLVEMTRKKVRQRVSSVLHAPCPYCGGSGQILTVESVALKVRKEWRKLIAEASPDDRFILKVHKDVADYLEAEELLEGGNLEIYRSRSLHRESFSFARIV